MHFDISFSQQIFSEHLLYTGYCIRSWRIHNEQKYRSTPAIRELLDSWGRVIEGSCPFTIVTSATQMRGKRSVEERFVEQSEPLVFGFGLESPGCLP